jgi:hypothetical protein
VKKLALLCLVIVIALNAGAYATQPPAREGFVPVDQLEGQEQMPAAPLVAAAYGVAWGAVLVFVWTVWRRLGNVERELADVGRRIDGGVRR